MHAMEQATAKFRVPRHDHALGVGKFELRVTLSKPSNMQHAARTCRGTVVRGLLVLVLVLVLASNRQVQVPGCLVAVHLGSAKEPRWAATEQEAALLALGSSCCFNAHGTRHIAPRAAARAPVISW